MDDSASKVVVNDIIFPTSFASTVFESKARIIGDEIVFKTPTKVEKYICQVFVANKIIMYPAVALILPNAIRNGPEIPSGTRTKAPNKTPRNMMTIS